MPMRLQPSRDGVAIYLRSRGVSMQTWAFEQGRYDARHGAYRPQLARGPWLRQVYDRGWQVGRAYVPNGGVGPTLLALTASGAWPPRPVVYDPPWKAPRRAHRNPGGAPVRRQTATQRTQVISLAPPGFFAR